MPMPTALAPRGALALLIPVALAALAASAHGQPVTDSIRQIQSVVPRIGPPGTRVEIFTENLPLQARVHVGVGHVGAGFEELAEATQNEWGAVRASVVIPRRASWDQAVVLILFDAAFAPIGMSDPFHVTNAAGLVHRRGEIVERGAACVILRDEDGFLYALSGELTSIGRGDPVDVEGVPAESSACGPRSAIDVARVRRR